MVCSLLDPPDIVVGNHVHAGDGLQRLRSGWIQHLSSWCVRPKVLPSLCVPSRRATNLKSVIKWIKAQNWHLNAIILQGRQQRVAVHSWLALIELIIALEHTGESLLLHWLLLAFLSRWVDIDLADYTVILDKQDLVSGSLVIYLLRFVFKLLTA